MTEDGLDTDTIKEETHMARGLWGAAAVVGGLYWASRQPGGLSGTWNRLKGAANDIKGGADPMSVGRRFVRGERAPSTLNDPALEASSSLPDI
jgi:hypothetical protein